MNPVPTSVYFIFCTFSYKVSVRAEKLFKRADSI
eukprot:UN05972